MTQVTQSTGPPIKKNAFVHKLYGMLNNSKLADLIWWSGSPEGHTFSLKPCKDFAQALNGYFKHGNIASFVRQLHMYGFHKVSDPHTSSQVASDRAPPIWEFRHSSGQFKKNDESSLAYIKRRSQLNPSRNPVIDNTSAPVNLHSSMNAHMITPHHVQYTKPFPSNASLPLGGLHPFPHPLKNDMNGALHPSNGVYAQYGEQQYYVRHVAPDPVDPPYDPLGKLPIGPAFINSAQGPQHAFYDQNSRGQPAVQRPHSYLSETTTWRPHEAIPSQPLHAPTTAITSSDGILQNLESQTLPKPMPKAPSSEGSRYLVFEELQEPSTRHSLGPSSLSSYSIMATDSTTPQREGSSGVEATTSPTNFPFRRPFSVQGVERQRNPSLLFDPLATVGNKSPRPLLSGLKGMAYDIRLPPLSALQSPLSKDGSREDLSKPEESGSNSSSRHGSALSDVISPPSRANSQSSLTYLSNPVRHPIGNLSSLRDKIRPSLVNLHHPSQNSNFFPGIQLAKTVDSIGSHSSSLFSNGSSISSTSTNRLSFDFVSYRRKSSLNVGPLDEAPPSPGFNYFSPGSGSPNLRRPEPVDSISEEALDSSTVVSIQGISQDDEAKTTPQQEPKVEFLVESAREDTRKKQKV